MADSESTVGIDIGGSRVKSVVVHPDGTLENQRVESSVDDVESLVEVVRRLLVESALVDGRVGISAPGIAAPDNLSIAWMRGRLRAVEGLRWQQHLGRPVRTLNDGHAATMGEAWIGAARGKTFAVMLTLGTGVGGGVILDGRLLQGATGRASHLGHISLNHQGLADIVGMPGSLEDCIGDHNVFERSGRRFRHTDELVRAVLAGDAQARACWRESIHGLAVGIAALINVFDPEIVVIGGGVSQCGSVLFEPLQEYLDIVEWRPAGKRVPVVAAELGEFAGAIGAARFASLAA